MTIARALVLAAFLIFGGFQLTHLQSAAAPVLLTEESGPLRLRIPAIQVDAPIESLGLTAAGAMDAPKGAMDIGWLSSGVRPGEPGSAVMDGHFGWKNGLPAAFDRLSDLRAGDLIYVENQNGTTTAFIVRELRTYGKDASSETVFSSADGKSHLNLITCEGVWDPVSKSYSRRLVVFADKAG